VSVRVIVSTKGAPTFSSVKLGNEFWEAVGRLAAADIARNVFAQRQADGSALKRNKQATTDRKAARGKPPLSLVDEDKRFLDHQAQYVVTPAANGVTITHADRTVFRAVQEKGYTGWFRLSRDGRAALRQMFLAAIKRAGNDASAARKTTGG
jgi:hypothetical protein